jgi:hypothetical protein
MIVRNFIFHFIFSIVSLLVMLDDPPERARLIRALRAQNLSTLRGRRAEQFGSALLLPRSIGSRLSNSLFRSAAQMGNLFS